MPMIFSAMTTAPYREGDAQIRSPVAEAIPVPVKDAKKAERGKTPQVRFCDVIPYKDENPTELPPIVTVGIIVLNVLTWLFVQGAGSPEPLARSVCQLGLIPGEVLRTLPPGTVVPLGDHLQCVLTDTPNWLTVVTSMFMHGGWLHLIGNMWFLWVFGNNIEDSMGHGRFVVFYLLCGVAAAATQVLVEPHAAAPMVGASGAISGVMGAYILLYPRVKVHTLVTLGFFLTTVTLPAYVMLGYWFVLQLLLGAATAVSRAQGGVAVWAHVGGFVAGLLLIKLFAKSDYLERRRGGMVILPRDV
jgi:membrane associated rhomboid family serine protease